MKVFRRRGAKGVETLAAAKVVRFITVRIPMRSVLRNVHAAYRVNDSSPAFIHRHTPRGDVGGRFRVDA
jgi:hypothetical protein